MNDLCGSVLVVIGDEDTAAQLIDVAQTRLSSPSANLHVLVIPGLAARTVAAAISVTDSGRDRRVEHRVAEMLATWPASVPVRLHTFGSQDSSLSRILEIVADCRIECVVLEGNELRIHSGFVHWLASACGDLPELLQHRARALNFAVVEVDARRHPAPAPTRCQQ